MYGWGVDFGNFDLKCCNFWLKERQGQGQQIKSLEALLRDCAEKLWITKVDRINLPPCLSYSFEILIQLNIDPIKAYLILLIKSVGLALWISIHTVWIL